MHISLKRTIIFTLVITSHDHNLLQAVLKVLKNLDFLKRVSTIKKEIILPDFQDDSGQQNELFYLIFKMILGSKMSD